MRKRMRRGCAVLMAAVLAVTSCNPACAAAKKKASLSKKKLVLQVGKKQKLKWKNSSKKVKWSIKSGKKYIKLQKKKKNSVVIRGVKPGKAKVQAKVGGKKYICRVTVKKAAAKKMTPTATPMWTAPPASMLNPTKAPSGAKATATPVPVEKDADQVKALQTMTAAINADIRDEFEEDEIKDGGYLVSMDPDDTEQYEWDSKGNLSMINWSGRGIMEESLSFAAFPKLRELYCQNNEGLEGIDVSGNPELEDLFCYYDGLESLDVNSNSELIELNCYGNMLEAKNFKYNKCTKIQTFRCGWNDSLGSINVSNMPDLKTLECASSGIVTSIDVSANEKLVELDCSGNEDMGTNDAELILADNPALKTLDCSDCGLAALDVSGNTALVSLKCSENALQTLDTSANSLLQTLECGGNGYTLETDTEDADSAQTDTDTEATVSTQTDTDTEAAVSTQTNTDTEATNSSQTDTGEEEEEPESSVTLQMDVSHNPSLTKLSCYGNGLYTLDISNNTALTYLDCSDNYLQTLDISRNTALSILNCSYNQLTTLNIAANPSLWDSLTLQYDEGVVVTK